MTEAVERILGSSPDGTPQSAALHLMITLLTWICVGLVIELFLRLIRGAGRRSGTDIDDILVAEARAPIWAILFFLALGDAVAPWLRDPSSPGYPFARPIGVAARVGFAAAVVWLGYRIVRHGVLRVAERMTSASETMLDDMLLPIVRTLIAPIALGIGVVLVLEAAGMPVQSIALVVGGASFILAFALRSTLEDVFGGVSLLVDTPFTYGDVLELEDGTVGEVVSLGLRVTRLYDASQHSVIVVPNRQLAGQKLVNSSRPTPDSRLSLRMLIHGDTPPDLVEERLLLAAHGHPYVLGQPDRKLSAMSIRMDRMVLAGEFAGAAGIIREMVRVRAEGDTNSVLDDLARHLVTLSATVHHHEADAFSAGERADIEEGLAELRRHVREVQRRVSLLLLSTRYAYVRGHRPPPSDDWLSAIRSELRERSSAKGDGEPTGGSSVRDVVNRYYEEYFVRADRYVATTKAIVGDAMSPDGRHGACVVGSGSLSEGYFALQAMEQCLGEEGFAAGLGDASGLGIVDLDDVEEYAGLVDEWNRRTRALLGRVDQLDAEFSRGSGLLLDEKLYELRQWISTDYHDVLPRWKEPSVSIVQLGDDLEYELKAYVDNVKLSHFTRVSKTRKQLHREIVALFRGIEPRIAFAPDSLDVTVNSVSTSDTSHKTLTAVARDGDSGTQGTDDARESGRVARD